MASVRLTRHLARFIPNLPQTALEVPAASIAALIAGLGALYPTLPGYLVDETGALRKHVNIFVDGLQVSDRAALSDPLSPNSEVMIFQSLSGG